MARDPKQCTTYYEFAQQVHYPYNALHPGTIYFKTPRKCAIFGVCNEGMPRQVNYLNDEEFDTGKGANTVISMLHHFLEHHALRKEELELHADNCVGQNKIKLSCRYEITSTTLIPFVNPTILHFPFSSIWHGVSLWVFTSQYPSCFF